MAGLAASHGVPLGIGVVAVLDLAEVAALHGFGTLLRRPAPCVLDLDKLGTGGDLTVDVGVYLGMEAGCVQTLIALHVREEGSVEPAAARAGNAGSGRRVEGGVFLAERCIGKREVEVGLYPGGQVLGGKQVRFGVLPVLAPALRIGVHLAFLGQTCEQVGVAGGDPLLAKRLGKLRDELQETQPGVDVRCALA